MLERLLRKMLKCKKCNNFKEIDQFNFRGSNSDKRISVCKACTSEYRKKYQETYSGPNKVKIFIPNGMKKCNICGILKPIDAFAKHNKSIDGKEYHCILCNRKLAKDWYKENSEHAQKYRDEHKRETQLRNKIYLETNRELKNAHNRKRRARKVGCEENYGREEKKNYIKSV